MTELERLRKSFNSLAEKHMETEAKLAAAERERDEARKEAKSLAQMHADDYDKRMAAEARAFAAARARDEAQQEASRLRDALEHAEAILTIKPNCPHLAVDAIRAALTPAGETE